ncbi:unnamed protein product [Chironomus riparius]|uniref:Uncharacterized protein n=1 Tax=Chironomus riparius TaxID=315576 RepID=A0A9N9WT41_9DIPT|nr:unnamed protein product [Chironomus riparius]
MESFTFMEAEALSQEADNKENSESMQVNSSACEICSPSLRIEYTNQEPAEEMQDAVTSRQSRSSTRPRNTITFSDELFVMPAPPKRSRSTKKSRGSSHGRAASGSRKSPKSNSRQRNRSRSKSASKRLTSSRGRRS